MGISSMAAAQEASVTRSLAGRRLGRYEVLTQLATGGMASVYIARAQGVAGFERLVAIKVLHPHLAHEEEFISMFLDEARLAARIHHPHVVPTLDISDTKGDGFFLVMEYIEGDHFASILQAAAKQGARLSVPVSCRVVIEALSGLGAAHRLLDNSGKPLHIVHRDVSPQNIMCDVEGISRLTDFGVAKAEVRLSSTRDGQFKGKLAYMSPEQARELACDHRSDLFSMAVVFWEALVGKRLFRASNHAATLQLILDGHSPPPSSIRPELKPFDPVLGKALLRDPAKRYQSADELSDAIEEASAEFGGPAKRKAVAHSVRTYAEEKLRAERRRIREATANPSSDLPYVVPTPSDGSGGASPTRPSTPDSITAASSASGVSVAAKAHTPVVLVAILGVALLGSLATLLYVVATEPASSANRTPELAPDRQTPLIRAPLEAAPSSVANRSNGVEENQATVFLPPPTPSQPEQSLDRPEPVGDAPPPEEPASTAIQATNQARPERSRPRPARVRSARGGATTTEMSEGVASPHTPYGSSSTAPRPPADPMDDQLLVNPYRR